MRILGVTSPLSVNTAACLVADGELVAFAEEERFTGVKYAPRQTPRHAIEYCLAEAHLAIDDVDATVLGYDPPFRAWGKNAWANLTEGNIARGVRETGAFVEYGLNMVRFRDYLRATARHPKAVLRKVHFVTHHVAHAASAARCSGFSECAVLTLDGVGEGDAGLLGVFQGNRITPLRRIPINQSLGWLYSLVTELCGFVPHSHEGKVMALAGFGTPDLESLRGIAELRKDGYVLPRNWYRRLVRQFGPPRGTGEPITQKHKDLAASVQYFLERAVLNLAQALHRDTGLPDLVLAGGVALNCDMNARLAQSDFIDRMFIQPAANDAGTALGAAYEWHARATGERCAPLRHVSYGPAYTDEEIESLLQESKLRYRRLSSLRDIAAKLAEGKIVGWFDGRMEFGPRALGNRSILSHPGVVGMKETINRKVKHRESWRPFAPSVLADRAAEYFEQYVPSPFMLLTFKTKREKRRELAACIHVDDTARVQEVSPDTHPRYAALIQAFADITGTPAVLNTSFNSNEKPICCTPQDALRVFFATGIDVLVLNNFVLEKR